MGWGHDKAEEGHVQEGVGSGIGRVTGEASKGHEPGVGVCVWGGGGEGGGAADGP